MTKLKALLPALLMVAAAMLMMSGAAMAGDPVSPEIDPGSMAGALTLLSGGVMMLAGRRRKAA